MLTTLDHPELQKYIESFVPGSSLFLEGDESTDIYILAEGVVEIVKSGKKIGEISAPGELFGEMSYVLKAARTATAKAVDLVRVIIIPGDRVEEFLKDVPELVPTIIGCLAQRLKETTQIAQGFREFCDQLPDAVIMTDAAKKIMAWNRAAEKLHGRVWREMKNQALAEVYQDPNEYKQFVNDIEAGNELLERCLAIKLPDGKERYVATSTTVLRDGHFNTTGYLFLSRNITRVKKLEENYRRIKAWLAPMAVMALALLVTVWVSLPNYTRGMKMLDHQKKVFSQRISRDAAALTVAVNGQGSDQGVQKELVAYLEESGPSMFGISGVVVLNELKKVIAAHTLVSEDRGRSLLGTSYSGIAFDQGETERFKILRLFRSTDQEPMGRLGIEVACRTTSSDGQPWWLVFQLDIDKLQADYSLDYDTLRKLDFSGDVESDSP